jgi:outer membrane protein TolC
MYFKKITLLFFLIFASIGYSQTLSLKEAIKTGLENYGSIRAKNNYTNASKETLKQSRRDYLPNLNLSAQQDYGTVNGQNGPLYGLADLELLRLDFRFRNKTGIRHLEHFIWST